jgi:Outer membrane protein beta-barrel domain
MRPLVLYFFTAALACAQIVSVGVKGGVPATQAVTGYYSSPTNILDTGRWTVGPTIEFRLLFGFSVEADALYRGYREQSSFTSPEFIILPGTNVNSVSPAFFFSSHSNTKVWDFPLLLKYRIGSRRFRPFVDAGYTFSHRTSDVTTISSCLSSQAVCQAATPVFGNGSFRGSFSDNNGGPTGGVGVEYRYGRVKIAPEVRYTHLSNPTTNLVTVMVGVTF